MRCKDACILLVIREQLHHKSYKNELFIVMSKNVILFVFYIIMSVLAFFLKRSSPFEFCITKYGLGYMSIVKI